MLIAQGRDTLYLGYGRDYRSVDLRGVPVERIALEEPKAYQEHAVFYHRPSHINDLNGQNPLRPVPERQTSFQVEQVVVLCDEQFRQFQETGLKDDQISCSITATRCGLIRAAFAGIAYSLRVKPVKRAFL